MTYIPDLVISAEYYGQLTVLRLAGELDLTSEDRLRQAVSDALGHHPALLVADLAALRFMDCAGLSVLVEGFNHLAGTHRQLLITGVQPIVRRLIFLRGLDTYLLLGALPSGLHDSTTAAEGPPLTGAPS